MRIAGKLLAEASPLAMGCLRLCAVAMLVGLTGCTIGPPSPQLAVRDDTFLPYREITTGRTSIVHATSVISTELLGRVDRESGAVVTLLDVEITYFTTHMAGFREARSANALSLATRSGYRHRSCSKGDCTFKEGLTVTIPRAELEAAGPQGYNIKLFSPAFESPIIVVQKSHIDQLLKAIAQEGPSAGSPRPEKKA